MPSLEILTRCYKRPNMLAANQKSLQSQTDGDWIQTLLVDEVGRGIGWSYQNMAAYAPKLVGERVWILDDDDECIRSTLVAELKHIAQVHDPDVIFLRMDHGELGVLPPDSSWGIKPVGAQIGVSAFVVRRQVWQAHAGALADRYDGDFSFIASVWASQPNVYWHDCIASRVQRISRGAVE